MLRSKLWYEWLEEVGQGNNLRPLVAIIVVGASGGARDGGMCIVVCPGCHRSIIPPSEIDDVICVVH